MNESHSKLTLVDLRNQISQLVQLYAEEYFAPAKFVPGQTFIPASTKTMAPEDLTQSVSACLDIGITAAGISMDFESALTSYIGNSVRSSFVNSGSSANLVAVSTLCSPMLARFGLSPLKPGDEVLTVAAGFPTTLNPLFQNGLVPVFVDVDYSTLNVTAETLMKAKSPRTRAVVIAHSLGNPFRADLIAQWCKDEGLYFIEDCCDALGATIGIEKRKVGSFGDLATLSFFPAHHITTGEGGAILYQDKAKKRVAESLRDWGRDCWCIPGKDNTCGKRFDWSFEGLPIGYDHKYTYSSVGYNLKGTDIQAALGLSQLKRINSFVETRRKNWKLLYDGVKSSPLLNQSFTPVEPVRGTDPSWFGFPLHCNEGVSRPKVTVKLENNRVGTRLMFGGNLVKQPAYKDLNFKIAGELTNTDRVMTNTFWIGVHPMIDESRIQYMLEQLENTLSY